MDVTRLTRFCRCHTFFSSLAKGTFDDVLRQCNGTDATNGLLKELKLTDFKVSGGFHVVPNAEDKARFSALAEMASIMNDIFVNCCLSYMPLTKATLDSAVKASARLLLSRAMNDPNICNLRSSATISQYHLEACMAF